MNTQESLDKLVKDGILGLCEKHGDKVYFDASVDCPTCQEKAIRKKGKVTSLVKAEPEPEEPQGFMEKFKAMPTQKKAILIGVAVGIMWLAMNVNSIMSYFK